jgi:hypothetical protein
MPPPRSSRDSLGEHPGCQGQALIGSAWSRPRLGKLDRPQVIAADREVGQDLGYRIQVRLGRFSWRSQFPYPPQQGVVEVYAFFPDVV